MACVNKAALQGTRSLGHSQAIGRRAFAMGALALALRPNEVRAQQRGKVPHVVFFGLNGTSPASIDGFKRGLTELGYVEGQNITVDYVISAPDQLSARAAQIVALRPDVIVTGTTPPTLAAMRETKTIAIVA